MTIRNIEHAQRVVEHIAQVRAAEPYEVVCRADDPDWLRLRLTGIGASEAAALIGVNPWKSAIQLYAEKTGALKADDLSDNEAVFWGTKLEAVVRDVYGERSRRHIDKGGLLLRSRRYPWALCTLDGWTSDIELGPYWPLEIKTAGASKASDWVDGPPEAYVVQVNWQMLVTDTRRATIACLLGGQKLVWCDVERDEQLVRKLVHHGGEFWDRVLAQNPPLPDGTEGARRTLHALYPTSDDDVVTLGPEYCDLADELDDLKLQRKAVEDRQRELENTLKAALGEHGHGALIDGRLVDWETVERRGYTVKPSTSRVLRVRKKTSRA